jgi:hypothetical protein
VAASAVEQHLLEKEREGTSPACGVIKAISEHSDVVAGQYEGFKKKDIFAYTLHCNETKKCCY